MNKLIHKKCKAVFAVLKRASFIVCFSTQLHAADGWTQRPEVQSFINELVTQDNFDAPTLANWFAQAELQPRALKYIAPPSDPGVRSWRRYRSRYIEPFRIGKGIEFWQQYEDTLNLASQKYGVPPEIIVGIIGVETIYGRHTGNFETFSTLATLAFNYPPRADLFRKELRELLLLAREQKRAPTDYSGSYAGAIGIPQFLPSSYRKYAVAAHEGDAADIIHNPKDAIMSVAHYLNEFGWQRDSLVATPAHIAPNADLAPILAADINPQFDSTMLAGKGVSASGAIPDKAALIELVTPNEASEYWLGFNNFYVITRYNKSSFYAMAVFQLADTLRLLHDKQK